MSDIQMKIKEKLALFKTNKGKRSQKRNKEKSNKKWIKRKINKKDWEVRIIKHRNAMNENKKIKAHKNKDKQKKNNNTLKSIIN
jgi:hypothetical protein